MTTYGDLPAPRRGLILTHFLTRARRRRLAGLLRRRPWRGGGAGGKSRHRQGRQQLDHHEPGRPATPDKPDVTLRHPSPGTRCRCSSIRAGGRHRSFHREATAKGAQFLTEPLDRKAELRCYLRDLDGFLVEVGQATSMLEGVFADPPAGNQLMRPGTRRAPVAARCEPDSSAEWASERGERIASASTSVVDASCVLGRRPAPPQPPAEPRRGCTDSSLSPWLVTRRRPPERKRRRGPAAARPGRRSRRRRRTAACQPVPGCAREGRTGPGRPPQSAPGADQGSGRTTTS